MAIVLLLGSLICMEMSNPWPTFPVFSTCNEFGQKKTTTFVYVVFEGRPPYIKVQVKEVSISLKALNEKALFWFGRDNG